MAFAGRVRELERLRAGEFKDSNPLLTEVAREIIALPIVFLALVLHDIGKGHGHDHQNAARSSRPRCASRMGLDGEETDLVVFWCATSEDVAGGAEGRRRESERSRSSRAIGSRSIG